MTKGSRKLSRNKEAHKGGGQLPKAVEQKVERSPNQFITRPELINNRQVELFGKPLIDEFVNFFNQPSLLSAQWLWDELKIPEDEIMQYFAHVSDLHNLFRQMYLLIDKFLVVLRQKMDELVGNVVKRVNGKDKYAIDVFFVQFAVDDLVRGSMLKFGNFLPLKNNLMVQFRTMLVGRFFADLLVTLFERGEAYKVGYFLDGFDRMKAQGFDNFARVTGISLYDLVKNFYFTERNLAIVNLKNSKPLGEITGDELEETKELNQVMALEVLDQTLFKSVDFTSLQCGPFLVSVNQDPVPAGQFRMGMSVRIDCLYEGKEVFLRQVFLLERSTADFYVMLGAKRLNDIIGDYWAEEIKKAVFSYALRNLATKEDEVADLLVANQVLATSEQISQVVNGGEAEVEESDEVVEQLTGKDDGEIDIVEDQLAVEQALGPDSELDGDAGDANAKKSKAVNFRALGAKNLKARLLFDILCKIMGPPVASGGHHFCFRNKKGFKYAISLHFSQPVRLRLLQRCLNKWEIMEEFVQELNKTVKKPVGDKG